MSQNILERVRVSLIESILTSGAVTCLWERTTTQTAGKITGQQQTSSGPHYRMFLASKKAYEGICVLNIKML